jgi:CheY-like chemotaxis protein
VPKILLVEDDEDNYDMLTRRLERQDYATALAVDGEEGVALAASERPDLILMDIKLPGVDGYGATQQIREASEYGRDVPIIALTAHALTEDRNSALEAGCDDYHAKPVFFTRLIEQIETLLTRDAEESSDQEGA